MKEINVNVINIHGVINHVILNLCKIKYYKDDLQKLSLNLIYYINYLKNALLKKNYFNYTYMFLINLS